VRHRSTHDFGARGLDAAEAEQVPTFPPGPFDLAVIDLPLSWRAYSAKGEGRSPQSHYRTLDIATLISWRPQIDSLLARDAMVACWIFGPRLPDTLSILNAWGLAYSSEAFTWVKLSPLTGRPCFGAGKTTRKGAENMWLAKRGKGLPVRDHGVRQVIFAPRGRHSEKPDAVYQAIERLYGPVRRVELFARKQRPGWTVWGDEIASGDEEVFARICTAGNSVNPFAI
jgi:N6-adenosine-specific RNA methylase IME4